MDYLNRGKEFKYIDVREGRKGIDTGKKQTNGTPVTNKQTNKQTNKLTFYIYILTSPWSLEGLRHICYFFCHLFLFNMYIGFAELFIFICFLFNMYTCFAEKNT